MRRAAVALVLLVGAAGCGNGGPDTADATSTETATPAATAPAGPAPRVPKSARFTLEAVVGALETATGTAPKPDGPRSDGVVRIPLDGTGALVGSSVYVYPADELDQIPTVPLGRDTGFDRDDVRWGDSDGVFSGSKRYGNVGLTVIDDQRRLTPALRRVDRALAELPRG